MKGAFTQSMAWLHTWCGLLVGWLLFAIFLTGTLSVFEHEISHWMQPELHRAGSVPRAEALARAERVLQSEAARVGSWQIILPDGDETVVEMRWRQEGARIVRHLDAAANELLSPRATLGGHFFVEFHYSLMGGRTGIWVVAAMTMALLVTLVSGIVIHKRIFRDFFTFRPRAAPQRAWLDGHNAFAVLALPFHLMITYTGLVISFGIYMPVGLQLFFGGSPAALRTQVVTPFERPLARQSAELLPLEQFLDPAEAVLGPGTAQTIVVRNPGDANAVVEVFRRFDDRIAAIADHVAFDGVTGQLLGSQTTWNRSALVWRVLVGLHLAQFGGDMMRWLYFSCGLIGTAMVGSGVILFSVKRRHQHAAEASRFDRAVERVNVAAIAGVIITCVAFLWLNHLLPPELPHRQQWEMGLLLPIWLAALLHAASRRPGRAWSEQLGLAAVLCTALPLLDAVVTGDLVASLTDPVSLVALASGSGLALTSWHLARRSPFSVRRNATAMAHVSGSKR